MNKHFFKLAVMDPRLMTFRDLTKPYNTAAEALLASKSMPVGTYRISEVNGSTRKDGTPFESGTQTPVKPVKSKQRDRLASRPMGGEPH